MRSCNTCKYLVKRKSDIGICERFDLNVKADDGHKCEKYSALKFDRNKLRKIN